MAKALVDGVKGLGLEEEDRLIIGLDFGTTFSGIAYAFVGGDEKPEVVPIVEWPGKVALESLLHDANSNGQVLSGISNPKSLR